MITIIKKEIKISEELLSKIQWENAFVKYTISKQSLRNCYITFL